MSLLNKTRSLNRLLQQAAGKAVSFKEMSKVLAVTMQSNVFVLSRKGKVLGCASSIESEHAYLLELSTEDLRISNELNEYFLDLQETTSHLPIEYFETSLFKLTDEDYNLTVVPIIGSGERLGTLVLVKNVSGITDDDLVLAEYGTTIVAMEILRERSEEIAEEARKKAIVSVAVHSLSYSELEAVEHIFEELKDKEGLLVASKIADRVGITRSVIVNALRKLESAGVIETRSLGMKGTYIKIIITQLLEELRKIQE